jgi:hypothetical protein
MRPRSAGSARAVGGRDGPRRPPRPPKAQLARRFCRGFHVPPACNCRTTTAVRVRNSLRKWRWISYSLIVRACRQDHNAQATARAARPTV